MKSYKIKGSLLITNASCLKAAIRKLVGPDFTYRPHCYTKGGRRAWANVATSYGYECIVEEV